MCNKKSCDPLCAVLITIVVIGMGLITLTPTVTDSPQTLHQWNNSIETALLYFYSTVPQVMVAAFAFFLFITIPHLDQIKKEIDESNSQDDQDEGKGKFMRMVGRGISRNANAVTGEMFVLALQDALFHSLVIIVVFPILLLFVPFMVKVNTLVIVVAFLSVIYFARILCSIYYPLAYNTIKAMGLPFNENKFDKS